MNQIQQLSHGLSDDILHGIDGVLTNGAAMDPLVSLCLEQDVLCGSLVQWMCEHVSGQKTVQKDHLQKMSALVSAVEAARAEKASNDRAIALASKLLPQSVGLSVHTNEAAIANSTMLNDLRDVDQRAQGISSATEEMVASVSEISQRGREVSEKGGIAARASEEGRTAVAEVVQTMQNISRAVTEGAERVEILSEASVEIGDIVSQIDEIASQTNMLALNATIEAARAGEAGKGFAVVAGEVKSLAKQTAEATEDIRTRIDALRADMIAVVETMRDGSEAVQAGMDVVARTESGMENIAQSVNGANALMAEISGILDEQTQATNEIAEGIVKIAERSTHNVESLQVNVRAMSGLEKAIGAQLQQLSDFDVPNKTLILAKSDHVIWKKRLADMMAGLEGLRTEELSDHTTCRLGKWYYSAASEQFKAGRAFKDLERPHELVHTHGKRAVELYNSGKTDQALEELQKVSKASEDVLAQLDALYESAS